MNFFFALTGQNMETLQIGLKTDMAIFFSTMYVCHVDLFVDFLVLLFLKISRIMKESKSSKIGGQLPPTGPQNKELRLLSSS